MTYKHTLNGDGPNSGRWMNAGYILTGRETKATIKRRYSYAPDFYEDVMKCLEVLKAHNVTYAYLYTHGPIDRSGPYPRPQTSFDVEFPTEADAMLSRLVYEP